MSAPAAPSRELTLRALLTGLLLGALLTPANVYSGLKIGWSFNMSIIALLIGYGFWNLRAGGPSWTRLESNISQTAASSAASIISGGLVAPIPAYALLSGRTLDWLPMSLWVFSVSFLGIWIAWYLRQPLLERSGLRFPAGMATLETLQDIFAEGRQAIHRLRLLTVTTVAAAALKWSDSFWISLPRWTPGSYWERLTFSLDPSPLLLGFGAIIGLRVGLSLLLGSLLAWGGIAPWLLDTGQVQLAASAQGPQFSTLVEWLLWPGVTLMVSATLTQLLCPLYRLARIGLHSASGWPSLRQLVPLDGALLGLGLSALLVVILQYSLFGISLFMALLTLPLAILLATVAARVVGETAIPPIGAIGKLSQLGFGLAAPGDTTLNLMSANTAGGAAGQCADLLNDFRTGLGVGANPRCQLLAQCGGVLIGSLVGSACYLLLIPDPQQQLLSPEWPAPAVATWKAVAETLSQGLASIPLSARIAMLIAALGGGLLGWLEYRLPDRQQRWMPSCTALGLAFVIPASVSLTMALCALLGAGLRSTRKPGIEGWIMAGAAGLVAGESLAGVGGAFWAMLG